MRIFHNRASIVGILALLAGTTAPSAWAVKKSEVSVNLEPIIGYERVQKVAPTPHSTDRLTYGARLTAGYRFLAAEAELTRGSDSESYPLQNLSTRDTDDKLKLGLRGSYQLTRIFSTHLRGGVQAKRNTHEETLSGSTVKTAGKPVYDPYAGLGLSSRIGKNFSLTGGITVVSNEFPEMKKNDYQTTLGFTVNFP